MRGGFYIGVLLLVSGEILVKVYIRLEGYEQDNMLVGETKFSIGVNMV
jgi:hypothetical protein